MRDTRCKICSRRSDPAALAATRTDEYSITYNEVCETCSLTLDRALAGIVLMLRDAHGEEGERVLARLMDRLAQNGFDTTNFRRTA